MFGYGMVVKCDFYINKMLLLFHVFTMDVLSRCTNADEVSVVKDDHEILKEMVLTENTAWYIITYYRLGDTHQPIGYWINCYIESYFKGRFEKILKDWLTTENNNNGSEVTTRTYN